MPRSRGRRSNEHKTPPSLVEAEESYGEVQTNFILPEVTVLTAAAQVPELKKKTSYWQIETAPSSRVKVNALRGYVPIRSECATTITGMNFEDDAKIETLGTAVIRIFDIALEVHVIRSRDCSPIIADGILGGDFLAKYVRCLRLGPQGCICMLNGVEIPVRPADQLMENCTQRIWDQLNERAEARKNGVWSVVPASLKKLRKSLPLRVAEDERLAVIEVLEEYEDCFHLPGKKLGCTPLLKYSIKTKFNDVVWKEQPHLTVQQWEDMEVELSQLLDQRIITVSTSPYNSPVRLIEKKPNSKGIVNYRLAVDYRELNNRSHGDAFPIPDIIDLVDRLHGAKYFSVLDLASASYQIALDPKDSCKTAFTTRKCRYEFLRMPAGIKNASQNLQRMMHQVLDDMLCPSEVFVCYDDILVHAPSLAEHEIRLRKVLSRLKRVGLKLQPDKCRLFESSVDYLGYRITDEGLRPHPDKIKKLTEQSLPKTVHELSSFLGLLGSFKRFIPDYASRSKAMANLLKTTDTPLYWRKEAKHSFHELRKSLSRDLLLHYPDWNREFVLETRTSHLGIAAAVLQHKFDGAPATPIAYASRLFTSDELSMDFYDQERLAAIYGMETFYWYFTDANKFTLRTAEPKAFDWYRKRESHKWVKMGGLKLETSTKLNKLLTKFESKFPTDLNFSIEPIA